MMLHMRRQLELARNPIELVPTGPETVDVGPVQDGTARRSPFLHDLELRVVPIDANNLAPNAVRTGAITDIRLSSEGPDRKRVSMEAYETQADGHIEAWGLIQNAQSTPEDERTYTFQPVGLHWRGVDFLAYLNYVIPAEDSVRVTMAVTQRQSTVDFGALDEVSESLGEAMVAEMAELLQGEFSKRKIDLVYTLQGPLEAGHSKFGAGVCAMGEIAAGDSATIDTKKFDDFWRASLTK